MQMFVFKTICLVFDDESLFVIRGPTLVKGLKKVNLSELEYGEDLPMGPGHA